MNNLDTWKYLQAHNYFANHNCYKTFHLAEVNFDLTEKIKNKVMVEIGCGYGRESYYFSKYVSKLYAIDVSDDILNLTKETVQTHGFIDLVKFVLAESYKTEIYEPINYVYAKHVFQHITPELAKDYLQYFKTLLTKDGEVDILLRYGSRKIYPENREPLVEYNLPEIEQLFEGYTITDMQFDKGKDYELWRIIAKKK